VGSHRGENRLRMRVRLGHRCKLVAWLQLCLPCFLSQADKKQNPIPGGTGLRYFRPGQTTGARASRGTRKRNRRCTPHPVRRVPDP
jgi:hypothetical protein